MSNSGSVFPRQISDNSEVRLLTTRNDSVHLGLIDKFVFVYANDVPLAPVGSDSKKAEVRLRNRKSYGTTSAVQTMIFEIVTYYIDDLLVVVVNGIPYL